MKRLAYAYAIINKTTNMCQQTLETNNGNWNLNDEEVYSVVINPAYVDEYLYKYYYNSQWWERVWSEVDEHGEPVEGASYTDVPWIAGEG